MFDEFDDKKRQDGDAVDTSATGESEGTVNFTLGSDTAAADNLQKEAAQDSVQMSDSFNYGTVEGSSYRYSNVNGSTDNKINDSYQSSTDDASDSESQSSKTYSDEKIYTSYNISDDVPPQPSGNPAAGKSKPKKEKGFARKLAMTAAIALVFGAVGGAAFQAVNLATGLIQGGSGTTKLEQTDIGTDTDIEEIMETATTQTTTTVTDVSSVVEAVMPSVVSIINKATVTQQGMFGQSQTYESEGSGSGIIIGQNDTEMLIVTNNHVIEGADTITVTFIDEQTYEAQVKGTDADMDLAVIAIPLSDISEDSLSKVKIAVLGDSDALTVGEPAIAIGNALGYGQSVTTGVISALNREVTVDNVTNELIQTDAAINPGNSGGALLNIKGEVIGINAVKFASSEVEGMGYAIPISAATPIIDELKSKETRTKVRESEKGYLGIQGVDVTSDVASTYNMPMGVYVAAVVDGSAADDAGLVKGDIITGFDGNSITSMEGLQEILEYYAAGTTVDITVQKSSDGGYEEKTVTITLGERS